MNYKGLFTQRKKGDFWSPSGDLTPLGTLDLVQALEPSSPAFLIEAPKVSSNGVHSQSGNEQGDGIPNKQGSQPRPEEVTCRKLRTKFSFTNKRTDRNEPSQFLFDEAK